MKIIADLADRYAKLQGMAEDPKVINSDGTQVDPFLEIAAELFEVHRGNVTFEQRNHAIKITRHVVEQSTRQQAFATAFQAANNARKPWKPQ